MKSALDTQVKASERLRDVLPGIEQSKSLATELVNERQIGNKGQFGLLAPVESHRQRWPNTTGDDGTCRRVETFKHHVARQILCEYRRQATAGVGLENQANWQAMSYVDRYPFFFPLQSVGQAKVVVRFPPSSITKFSAICGVVFHIVWTWSKLTAQLTH